MNVPTHLLYTKSHEWVELIDDTTAKIGLTDFAQHALGDIVFINLPEVGDAATKAQNIADIESVKAVSNVFSSFTGEVTAINEELLDAPEKINSDPYGTWLLEISGITDRGELLDPAQYETICGEGA